ncbi:COP9 signalosome complex subunit 2 [Thraustotheca clavata]|uniref:COP9 signalosome complex subunit 2 n=1 Tax=Thraustotheca clavata TaxID=74557 RepID=A0A1V9ZK91_9STRA|nr:COP9 signalosome complex subunit 2 [Thraustotheca clavata]
MSDEEEYEFEYSDDDDMGVDEESLEVRLENQYYMAKGLKEESGVASSQVENAFKEVLELDEDGSSIWGFRALKQLIKWQLKRGSLQAAMTNYEALLARISNSMTITRNMGEKGVNGILDFVSTSPQSSSPTSDEQSWAILQEFYEKTLETLQKKDTRNERLWFKTNLKLGNALFEQIETAPIDPSKRPPPEVLHAKSLRLFQIVKELLASCDALDSENAGANDEDSINFNVKKDSQLLEVYALQIQLYTAQKDNKKLVELYEKALRVKPGVAHPRIIGVIRECGGKMHMMQGEWDKARSDFFEGFKSFDEAGEPRRVQCLKYLVLANMLSDSKINVFDSQEAKPYEGDKAISAMTELTDAFLHDDIVAFEAILKRHRESIMDDGFLKQYITNLLKTIRSKVLVKLVKPYRIVHLSHLATELNGIPVREVEELCASLILESRIAGHIDQIKGMLVLANSKLETSRAYVALNEWSNTLDKLRANLQQKHIDLA